MSKIAVEHTATFVKATMTTSIGDDRKIGAIKISSAVPAITNLPQKLKELLPKSLAT
jgi:hypothetical protein